ncbi:MAG TPA: sugar ABC transporter permease [Spirochaetales bacterium]|nr:sugar ABC transporter permease [Spirochaetales bacterium]
MRENTKLIIGMLSPTLIFLIFLLGAVGWAFYASFTDIMLIGPAAKSPQVIGLENYARLFRDPSFYNSLVKSAIYTGSVVAGQCALGLFLAVLMHQKAVKIKSAVAAAVTMSWIIPDIVKVYTWGAFVHYDGTLNSILRVVGVPSVRWLSQNPLGVAIVGNIWGGTAFSMILFLSALETVPPTIYEAAEVDGASSWQKFKSITLPLTAPVILIDLFLITIWTFGYFTFVFGLTGGGPGRATEIAPVFIYNEAFNLFKVGYGAAISFIMTVMVAMACIGYLILLKRIERV